MAVNVSAVQFRQAQLPDLVRRVVEEAGVAPHLVGLELTEGVALDDPTGASQIMDRLHAQGIRLLIDDFGTGYSSLSQLRRFQVSKLKIDRSFINDLQNNPEDRAIVRAIISMARALDMLTLAEGVESAWQMDFLREEGCEEIQGFYFSRPLPADDFETFVRRHHQTLAATAA
jgi:EAL domain-containing protein (putative c-di-GMP-specific phosphodiesterase class I)